MRKISKELQSVEKEVSKFAFASVCTTVPIKKGERLTKNIWVKRPGTGDFLADSYKSLLNKTAKKNIKPNTQIKKKDIILITNEVFFVHIYYWGFRLCRKN